ncbi:MAG: Calx-beta domain-containing protein, partial [Planctomycetaceae bacterium]
MFKSDWLRGLRAILGPFTCLSATRRHNVRSRALRSVQSLEPRDLLTVSLALSAVAVSESDDAATRVITLTAESDVPVAQDGTVEISVAGLTASDYSLSDLIIVIPAGQQQGSATLTISDDDLVELAETAVISLINPTGGLLIDAVDGTQSLLVADNDQAQLSIDDVAIAEGDNGTAQLVFTVTLDAAVDVPVTVDYEVAAGTAVAGSDYAATPGTLSFAANGTVPQPQQIAITVNGDRIVELDETLFANLLNLNAGGRNVTIADSQGLGTILADDSANVSVAISSVKQWEGEGVVVAVTVDLAVQGGFEVIVNMTGVGTTQIERAELVGEKNPDFSI